MAANEAIDFNTATCHLLPFLIEIFCYLGGREEWRGEDVEKQQVQCLAQEYFMIL